MATKDLGQVVGPAGPKGDTGSQGIQGPTGPAGPKGDTGSTGPAGSQGPKGDTGAKGDTGDPGPGVATGGAAGQFLKKHSSTNYDTEWETLTGAGIPVSGSDATKSSASLENLSGGIAIVAVGNTHVAISQEQYVYVREHGTLSEGLYKALSNIASNATLSTSNLSAVSGGLGAEVSSLNSKIETIEDISTYISSNIADFEVLNAKKWGHIVDIAVRGTPGGDYGQLCTFNSNIAPLVTSVVSANIVVDGYEVPTYAKLESAGIWVVNKGHSVTRTTVHAVYMIA